METSYGKKGDGAMPSCHPLLGHPAVRVRPCGAVLLDRPCFCWLLAAGVLGHQHQHLAADQHRPRRHPATTPQPHALQRRHMQRRCLFAAATFCLSSAQPHNADPIDPRHHRDARCPKAVTMDPPSLQRDPASKSSYLYTPMAPSATAEDCAYACCGDWSCEAFAFIKPKAAPPAPKPSSLSGSWFNHDSLRGVSDITITQAGSVLHATSLQPGKSMWSVAVGILHGNIGWLVFGKDDPTNKNNRTFTVSDDHNTLVLRRLSFDPPHFTQRFTRAAVPFGPYVGGNCTGTSPCCVFKDDLDALVPNKAGSGVVTGRRAKLPARPPPYPNSTAVLNARLLPKMEIGINGDEFPSTREQAGQTPV
jgi:hypothetical protein